MVGAECGTTEEIPGRLSVQDGQDDGQKGLAKEANTVINSLCFCGAFMLEYFESRCCCVVHVMSVFCPLLDFVIN